MLYQRKEPRHYFPRFNACLVGQKITRVDHALGRPFPVAISAFLITLACALTTLPSVSRAVAATDLAGFNVGSCVGGSDGNVITVCGGGGGFGGGYGDYSGGNGPLLHGGGGGHASTTVPNKGDAANKPDANQKTPCDQRAKPVVFSTGNEIESETDFVSVGDAALSLTRTYNHYWDGIGIFGRRWISDYDYKLLFVTEDPTSSCYPRPGNTPCNPVGQSIWAQRPDGRKIKFNYVTSPVAGWYEDKPSPIAKILKTDSTFTLYSEDHTVEVYDAAGFPSSIKNQQGIGWTFQYDGSHYLTRVTHASGRHVDFGWTGGLLTQVTDPAGNVYRYTYKTISTGSALAAPEQPGTMSMVSPMLLPVGVLDDPPPTPANPPVQTMVALLTSTTQPGSKPTVITYYYEDGRFQTALTGKSINNVRDFWITYDGGARAIESRQSNSLEKYTFDYTVNSANTVTGVTITNPLSRKTTYAFNDKGDPVSISGQQSSNCAAYSKLTSYDAAGYPSGKTDFDGNVTTYQYAPTGQLLQQVAGDGTTDAQITDYVWNTANNRLAKETLEGSREISYAYNSDNRLVSMAFTNLSTKVPASTGRVRTTIYTYTKWPNGLVATSTVDGPLPGLGDAITANYSEAGDLLSVKNGLSHTTSYSNYNGLGLPGSVTGPNGDKRSYVYDARGRITDQQTFRNGSTQHAYYEYDGFGRLARITAPDGLTHSFQYDAVGRMVAEFEPEAGGTFAETIYTYNAMSLPTSVKKQRISYEPARGTVP